MLPQKKGFRRNSKLQVNYLIVLPLSLERKRSVRPGNSRKTWGYWKRRLRIGRRVPKINFSARWTRMPGWGRKQTQPGRVTRHISLSRKRQVSLPERCVELYLKPDGNIAFVMPYAALTRRQYTGFRSGIYG